MISFRPHESESGDRDSNGFAPTAAICLAMFMQSAWADVYIGAVATQCENRAAGCCCDTSNRNGADIAPLIAPPAAAAGGPEGLAGP